MKRRELLQSSAAFGFIAAIPFLIPSRESKRGPAESSNDIPPGKASPVLNQLKPPAHGSIPVAFAISEGAVVIDFSGPWEVFETVYVPGRAENPFQLYTVAATTKPIAQAED